MISYFNRNNRHAYDRSMFILSIGSSNSTNFITKLNNMPINIIDQEIFNHSDTRFNFNLIRGCRCSSITLMNHSWSFSMFFYPNRERWFLNISRRNNWINIVKYSFFFNWYRFTAYVERPPFPARIKGHAKTSTIVRKSNTRIIHLLSKSKLNLVLLWLKISWMMI